MKQFLFRLSFLCLCIFSFNLCLYSQDFPKGSNQDFYTNQVASELQKANHLWENKEIEKAVQLYQKIIENCELSKNKKCKQAVSQANLKLTSLYLEQGILEDALQYASESVRFAEQQDSVCLTASAYLARSHVHLASTEKLLQVGNFEEAYKNEQLLINEAEKDIIRAKQMVDSLPSKHLNHINLPIHILINYGKIKKHQGEYRDAESWLMKAKKQLNERDSELSNKYLADLDLAKVYCKMNRPNDAIRLCQGFLNRGDTTHTAKFLTINNVLADAYERKQSFELSTYHLKKAMLLQNKRVDENTQERLHGITIRKELKRTNEKHKSLVKEKESKVEFLGLLRTVLTVISIAFLTLIIIFLYIFSKNKTRAQKLEYQLLKNQQDAEINAINALLDGREEEREKIGRFLHDQVASLLNSANIHLEVLGTELDKEYLMLTKSQDMIDEVADQIRSLSHNLLSDLLIKFGLAIALDDLCNRLTTPKIKFSFIASKSEEKKRYELSLENKFYNIAQELANNIIKHSQANTAFISLNEIHDRLVLRVKDNGIGFSESKLNEAGTGLHQIRIRLRSIGGEMKISREDGFTIVSLYVPLKIANRNKAM